LKRKHRKRPPLRDTRRFKWKRHSQIAVDMRMLMGALPDRISILDESLWILDESENGS
jgi:hypothetical protein